VTPGERRLDELVCALAASQPALHDFARARVAAKLRREIEELEEREAQEYGERAAARGDEMEAAHGERLAEIWCGLDDGEPAPEEAPEADDEAAREADLRGAARGGGSGARRQQARWLALAGSAAAVSAMMGLLHNLQGEEERPMLVSVEPMQGAPAAPAVLGPALASESEAAAAETRRLARAAAARKLEQQAERSARGRVEEAAEEAMAESKSSALAIAAMTNVTLANAGADQRAIDVVDRQHGITGEAPPAIPPRAPAGGIATELAGISERAAAAAALPPAADKPADEPAEYLRCAADVTNGLPDAQRCLTSFRARFPGSVYDADALAALALSTAEAERCGEALPLLDEYLARYADRAKAPLVRRQRGRCEERVQRRRDHDASRTAPATERD
jgi:hypothetical protein